MAQIAPGPPPEARRPTTTPATKPLGTALVAAAEGLYAQFREAGIDVLYDDRKMGAGAKMKDLELMGFPFLVYVGRSWKQDGQAEVRDRPAGEKTLIAKDEVFETIARSVRSQRRGLLPE